MTYATLKTNLTTYATTSGISNFYFGYLDDFDKGNRSGTYPAMIIVPEYKPLKLDSAQTNIPIKLEVFVLYKYAIDTDVLVNIFDLIDAKMLLFINAMSATTTSYKLMTSKIIPDGELFRYGFNIDNVVAIKYELDLEIYC
jgi:hypothetical protein